MSTCDQKSAPYGYGFCNTKVMSQGFSRIARTLVCKLKKHMTFIRGWSHHFLIHCAYHARPSSHLWFALSIALFRSASACRKTQLESTAKEERQKVYLFFCSFSLLCSQLCLLLLCQHRSLPLRQFFDLCGHRTSHPHPILGFPRSLLVKTLVKKQKSFSNCISAWLTIH